MIHTFIYALRCVYFFFQFYACELFTCASCINTNNLSFFPLSISSSAKNQRYFKKSAFDVNRYISQQQQQQKSKNHRSDTLNSRKRKRKKKGIGARRIKEGEKKSFAVVENFFKRFPISFPVTKRAIYDCVCAIFSSPCVDILS